MFVRHLEILKERKIRKRKKFLLRGKATGEKR